MGNTTVELTYRVRGDFSPHGLQKVFLSFHPDDIVQMEKVADDILSISNCALWYHADVPTADVIDLDDLGMKLLEMKLFVVIVSTRYLSNENLSKNWEYGFAMEHHISVLPIAVESGLEDYFAREMNRVNDGFGDLQLLRTEVADRTEMPYVQRLARDLRSILLEDREIERVRQAFSGKIFLSYRKTDRRYAQELIRTIHNIRSLERVSIWFDEFVSSGEMWSDRINEAIGQSDVVLLMVSPSITEPDNYVIREEYPTARKCGKPIVSAVKTANKSATPSIEELRRLFPGLRVLVDGDDADELEQALWEVATGVTSTPETDYLIGLAFFNGIDMERDMERAVSLIIASARRNVPDAVRKLAEMYWLGDGVAVNYENSILWRKRLVELREQKLNETHGLSDALAYVGAVESLADSLYELSSYRESLVYAKLLEQTSSLSENLSFTRYQARAYDLCGRNCRMLGLYDDALAYADKYHKLAERQYSQDPSTDALHNISVACARVGDSYYAGGDFEQAEAWYLRSLEIDRAIDGELRSIDSASSLSTSLLMLGDIYMRRGAFAQADPIYVEATELRKRVLAAEDTDNHQRQYGEAVLARGTALLLEGEVGRAGGDFAEAERIFRSLADARGTIEAQHALSVVLNRCGRLAEASGDYERACESYSESLVIRGRILTKARCVESAFEYAQVLCFKAGARRRARDGAGAKVDYEEAVGQLLPLLAKDRGGDIHRIFAEAAFERFFIDTYSGKRFLAFAMDGWKWLLERYPSNDNYHKQYQLCEKIYYRCYSE